MLEFKPIWIPLEEAINNNETIINSGMEPIANWINRETYALNKINAYINKRNYNKKV